MSKVAPPLGREWADPDPGQVQELITQSAALGWRQALARFEKEDPFFARRMNNLSLANWHVLLQKGRHSAALDIGCGFGSLALGLGEYYARAVGLDALQGRVAYASLRKRQDQRTGTAFTRGSGLELPFATGRFDLTTMNGVLEWAGYHAPGNPRELQLTMLREARRVLRSGGTAAVAIENRFAMETLAGMPDTHTGLRLVPALPRPVAGLVTRVRVQRPFRTFLYSAAGYRRLFREAGFPEVRVLDLVSSYNDYDFVVAPEDQSSYRFLWNQGLVRTFYRRAGSMRRFVLPLLPGLLGQVSYAYLLLAGDKVTTVLDPSHPVWEGFPLAGSPAAQFRFASRGTLVGSMVVVVHDGHRARGALEIGREEQLAQAPEICLTRETIDRLLPGLTLAGTRKDGRLRFRQWLIP